MKILILGGAGMLGHQLWRTLHSDHEVWVTLRKPVSHYANHSLFDAGRAFTGVDVSNTDTLEAIFRAAKPQAVVNCIGIIKQRREAKDPLMSIAINSMLPHRVASLCDLVGARMIHISTDCVFSGRKGGCTEFDVSDAEDLYGRTKFLGEVHDAHVVTLRTSIIGRELETKNGLIEWFLSQDGQVIKGFRKALYTGFTTHELARIIHSVLFTYTTLSGLWQVSSDVISKYDLLRIAQSVYGWKGKIEPDDDFVCNRALDSGRFRTKTGYRPPTWQAMLTELAQADI